MARRGAAGMVVDILRRIIGGRGGQVWDASSYADPTAGVGIDYGDEGSIDYDALLANLEIRREELEHVKNVIINEIKDSYNTLVKAMRAGDRETAELLAAEIAVKKNIAKALTMVTKLLSVAAARIKTARTTEEAIKVLNPVLAILRGMSPYLSNVSPEIALQVSAIRDEIERMYSIPSIQMPSIDTKSVLEMIPDAKNVLRQAAREAAEELEKELPEEAPSTIDIEVLEDAVIEYIRSHGGRINIRIAAEELGVSPKLIRYVLSRLEERGVIRLAPASRTSEGALA